jgi:hypothetical protein
MTRDRPARAMLLALTVAMASAAGVAAQYTTEPIAEPVAFEARWIPLGSGPLEAWSIDGVDPFHEIGGQWRFEVASTSDPRFDGTVVYEYNDDLYRSLDLQVHHSEFHVTTEDGSWHERAAAILGHPDLRPSTRTGVFDGAGAYDGLVAVAELTWEPGAQTWDVRGYIVAGGFPPLPGEGSRPD